jgi:bla regulator protein blaR1
MRVYQRVKDRRKAQVLAVPGADLSGKRLFVMIERVAFGEKTLLIAASLWAISSPSVLGQRNMPQQSQAAIIQAPISQTQKVPEWQTAAGGKMEFEVASIRIGDPGKFTPPNFALNIDDTSIPPGGRFSADFPLEVYIEFAYKIMPSREQTETMLAHLPKWVTTDRFVIQAKAEGNPTKDQMRLMMQSLLADRFKLAVHFETHEIPVLALDLKTSGEIGPRIRSHSEGPTCDTKLTVPLDRSSSSVIPGGFMPVCGAFMAISGPNHTVLLGARDVTLQQIADYLGSLGILGRPVVDQTGLSGNFDFSLNWMPERSEPSQPGADPPLDAGGPTLLEALKEQFGLNLKGTKAAAQVLVIDHVEIPSAN